MQQQKYQNMEGMPSEQIPYTAGLATFSQQFTKIYEQISESSKEILSENFWWLQADSQWIQILQKITEANCQQLAIATSQLSEKSANRSILSMIVQINFPSLLQLNLADVNLLNIELVAFLNMENLKKLDLSQNNIINLKPLDKQKWNYLTQLGFQANNIYDVDLSRTKLSKQFLYLEYNFHRDRNKQVQKVQKTLNGGISKIVKLEPQKIGFFRPHQDLNYLEQPKILKKIKQKYTDVNVKPIIMGHNFIINLE